jgi:hypothetical protein
MRRYFYLWMVMFLALMMAIPIHPMAQTQPPLKLRLMTETGDMITTNSPIIKNFFLSSDGVLAAILDSSQGALNFTFAADETDIGIQGITNCTIPGDGSVTATVGGGEFQFLVYSKDSGATISARALPGGTFYSGIYKWTPTMWNVGTYFAVFEASLTGKKTSQIVVMIKIVTSTQYTLTISVNPTGAGTVTGAGSYTAGSTATMTAQATGNYTFFNWTENGTPVGSAPTSTTNTITMNTAHTITANFTTGQQTQYTLTISVNPTGAGTVTGGGSYTAGSTATMTAQATGNYTFVNWTENGSPVGSAPTSTTNTITMNTAHTITANFTSSGTGKWSDQIAKATPITAYDEKTMVYIIYNTPIEKSGTYYFLANPKGVGAVHTQDLLRFLVIDTKQGEFMNIALPTVYKVDTGGNELAKFFLCCTGDFDGWVTGFTKDDYDKGVRFLLEIIEKGQGSGTAKEIKWIAY